MDIRPTLAFVIVDCPDARALARFYAALLGWEIDESSSDETFVDLVPVGGRATASGMALSFQQIDDYVRPTWPGGAHPQQFHLDFAVPDIAAAEPRLLELGATVHEHQPSPDGGFRVYLDPAGHPFCLILSGE